VTTPPTLPDWAAKDWGHRLVVDEWKEYEKQKEEEEDDNTSQSYRKCNGWLGHDLVHDRHAPVRILRYYLQDKMLTGIVHFTKYAESHQGFCHGGSMCSVLDDVIGWAGFCATGTCRPWTGFTVQINSALRQPIAVGSVLLVQANIVSIERRKVSVRARIVNPGRLSGKPDGDGDDGDHNNDGFAKGLVHAEGDGLVILNRGVLPGS